jgi:hypothetical protein
LASCSLSWVVSSKRPRTADALAFFEKREALQKTLLHDEWGADELGRNVLAIIRDERPSLQERNAKSNRLGRCTDVLYYAVHVAGAVGLIAAFWMAHRCS